MEFIILQITLIKQLKWEDMHITPHHSDWQTHQMNNTAFILEDPLVQMASFMALFHMSTTMMAYTAVI